MEKTVDITPDKSLIQKLGRVGYRTEQAIAELVDNSIDARIEGEEEKIQVSINPEKTKIEVSDNGRGMDEADLAAAMTVARETKPDAGSLGRFGIGLKSACSALGRFLVITTSKVGSNKEYGIEYDEKKWLADTAKDWKNFEITEKTLDGGDEAWHGTKVTIYLLKVPTYPNQVSKFKESFGIRYAPYLRSGQVSIQINSVVCQPVVPEMVEGSMTGIRLALPMNAAVSGHVALLEKRSIRGNYGIHLFKNRRLIKAYEKFGFSPHPENARVIGELNLDHVPVNFNKSEFIKESREYRDVLYSFKTSPELKDILGKSRSKKEITASVKSVFDYCSDRRQPPSPVPDWHLDCGVRPRAAREILDKTPALETKIHGKPIKIRLDASEGAPLYAASETGNGGITVTINKTHNAFKFVKNPLFLIGMIASEVKIFAANPGFENVIRERNETFGRFIDEWSAKPEDENMTFPFWQNRLQNIPRYQLNNELYGLYEHLEAKIGFKFQFTGLSTLVPYLHNMLGRIVYTIHTVPGNGQYLTEIAAENLKEGFIAAYRPDFDTIYTLLRTPSIYRVIAVREYATIKGSTVAYPEKAYLDLVNEVVTYDLPLDRLDLARIFSAMHRHGLINPKKLRTYSNFIKKTSTLESILEDRLEW